MSEKPEPPAAGMGEDVLQRVAEMMQFTPQARALGLEITRVAPAKAWGKAPYRADLVGDPDTGVIAGGVATTLLDQVCGVAAVAALKEPTSVATIDLRIDYMRPSKPGCDLMAEAYCYKAGRNVAFVRAVAYDASPDDPVAHAVATFMINANVGRKPGANLKGARLKDGGE
jgi:uncharacterized protein (TIGR00369 family)